VNGYVVMPENVHLLLNEPERNTLAEAIKSLRQGLARRLALRAEDSFGQARDYDFNVWSERKCVEKLRYIRRNLVTRGLVSGAAFGTVLVAKLGWSRLSRGGLRGYASGLGFFLR